MTFNTLRSIIRSAIDDLDAAATYKHDGFPTVAANYEKRATETLRDAWITLNEQTLSK